MTDFHDAAGLDEALRESEARFRLLAENVSDLVALHRPDGTFAFVTPSVEHVLGYAPSEAAAVHPLVLVHPEDAARARRAVERAVEQGATHATLTLRVRHKSGEYRWLETALRLLRDPEGGPWRLLSSSRDVTGRRRAEQALAQANTELRQRNRALQDFAYIASHDLQEPLRKVRAFADLMRQDYHEAVDEDGRYYLRRMQEAAGRMSDLTSALLRFSRITTQHRPFERVDLGHVVDVVCADLEVSIDEAGARIEVVGTLPAVEADPTQMRQLFQNLISNAVKFRRPEAATVVRIRAEHVGAEHVGEGLPAARCRISVEDNGIGFDKKYARRIFTPFQRLRGRSEYAGTGMGLAICRRIAEHHHGTIEVESAPGEGSTFTAVLPLRQPEEHVPDEHKVDDEENP